MMLQTKYDSTNTLHQLAESLKIPMLEKTRRDDYRDHPGDFRIKFSYPGKVIGHRDGGISW
jgi:hypothetical protein